MNMVTHGGYGLSSMQKQETIGTPKGAVLQAGFGIFECQVSV